MERFFYKPQAQAIFQSFKDSSSSQLPLNCAFKDLEDLSQAPLKAAFELISACASSLEERGPLIKM
jgi:hypothetical protein